MNPCNQCEKPFSETEFQKRSGRPGQWHRACKSCLNAARKAKYPEVKERRNQKSKEWQAANPERVKQTRKAHYENNKERVLAQAAVYRIFHKDQEKKSRKAHYERNKEHNLRTASLYRQANKGKVNAWQKQYQTRKRNAIPKWANLEKIMAIYEIAAWLTKESGEEFHVDHIVPLQGKTVCGLHCEANLTLLPATENLSKSNRYWPDMW